MTKPETAPVPLWEHQEREVSFALARARALLWDPRTGKTRAAIESLRVQIAKAGVQRVLIIAPQFVCSNVWLPELRASNLACFLWDLSSMPLKRRRDLILGIRAGIWADPQIILVNWEAISPLCDDLIKWHPEAIIADEMHYAKQAGRARSRALVRLGRTARFRRGLTGTPTPKNYVDLYSEYKFLDPSIFGTNKEKFLSKYVVLDDWGRPKFYRDLPELRHKMLSIASHVRRADIWKDQPPREVMRHLVMPEHARDVYDRLVTDTLAEYDGVEIDGTHKLTRRLRLQQLSAGFVLDEAGKPKWVHRAKVDAVVSELDDLLAQNEKVVVFYHFQPEGEEIEKAIRAKYGAVVGRIGGGTPLNQRQNLQRSFQNPASSLRVIVMQDSLGVGISLKAASYVIRTTYPLDYAAYTQSNDRIYEPGKLLTYIFLDFPHTIDAWAREVAMNKGEAQDRLLRMGFEESARGKINLERAIA